MNRVVSCGVSVINWYTPQLEVRWLGVPRHSINALSFELWRY